MTGAKANSSFICPRKRQAEHCWRYECIYELSFIYCEANTSTVWNIFSNWFTVVFDMKGRASLITRRSICTLCASKSSFNNNDAVCVSLAELDVCYSLNVLWVYGRAYGSTCRLFFSFFVHILSNQGVNMCGHQQDSMFFTLSFIKMSHLKVWSDDRSASLKIRKQRH